MMRKTKVLFFARSFLCKYYSEIKSDIIDPIFVTLTLEEKNFLQKKGFAVSGCFEDEYIELNMSDIDDNYLKTSLQSDRFLCRYSHKKRMEILGKEITFWRNILKSTNPDFLVNETIAVEIAEVMAIEAERLKIPFYTHLLGFLPNTFYWKPDPFSGRLQNLSTIIPSEENYKKAEKYIENVIINNERPFYVSSIQKHNVSIISLFHGLYVDFKIFMKERKLRSKIPFRYEDYSLFATKYYKFFLNAIFHKYDDISSIDGKNIIFYPMHLEPEAILNYFVDENYEQDAIVHNILNCLKMNQYLIVKEHPQQQGILLSHKYQELKKRNSNVIFLPSYESTFTILKKCDAIVTLTSTAAWEGLLLEKPVFVLGKIFFDQCPGATRINSFKQLKDALRQQYVRPDRLSITTFAASMITLFHKGCPSPAYKKNTIDEYIKAVEKLAQND